MPPAPTGHTSCMKTTIRLFDHGGSRTTRGVPEVQCRDAAMPRCRDAAMPQCHDAAMPRCRDAAMPRYHSCMVWSTPYISRNYTARAMPSAQPCLRNDDCGRPHSMNSHLRSTLARQVDDANSVLGESARSGGSDSWLRSGVRVRVLCFFPRL